MDRYEWREVYRVRSMLRYVLPRNECNKNEIAVAGSSALCWYQDDRKVGPMWGPPGDVDVFVAGYWGKSQWRFRRFCCRILRQLAGSLYITKKVVWYQNVYVKRGSKVNICDVYFKDMDTHVSFVQGCGCKNVQEVIKGFDIDVCKVIYHVHSESFEVTKSVELSIKTHTAWVKDDWQFLHSYPDRFDRVQIGSTMRRMQKYEERGFLIINGGGLTFNAG